MYKLDDLFDFDGDGELDSVERMEMYQFMDNTANRDRNRFFEDDDGLNLFEDPEDEEDEWDEFEDDDEQDPFEDPDEDEWDEFEDEDDDEDDDGSCIFVKKGRNGIVSVSTDAIEEFDRKIERMAKKKAEKAGCAFEKKAKKHSRSSTRNYGNRFEWSNIMIDEMPDDNTLRVVLMRGKQIVSSQEYDPAVCIPVELK